MRNWSALLACLLVACSAPRVGVDRDPDYDFAGKRTYAWKEGTPAESELQQERIVEEVDRALAQRGLQRVEGTAPDLWVLTEVTSRRELRSTGSSIGFGVGHSRGRGGVGFGTSTGNRVHEVRVGTLVIAILDGGSEEFVWRAQAENTLTNDPARTAATTREAIREAFESFP